MKPDDIPQNDRICRVSRAVQFGSARAHRYVREEPGEVTDGTRWWDTGWRVTAEEDAPDAELLTVPIQRLMQIEPATRDMLDLPVGSELLLTATDRDRRRWVHDASGALVLPSSPTDWALSVMAEEVSMITNPSVDALFTVGDVEITLSIEQRGGRYLVAKSDRSSAPQPLAEFSDEGSARRFLLLKLGAAYRSEQRWQTYAHSAPPEGVEIEAGPVGILVRWAHGDAEFRAGRVGTSDALQFAWATDQATDVIVSALTSRDGWPLYLPAG